MNQTRNLLLILVFGVFTLQAQDIPNHISYYRIYDFLDELANDGLIEINSAVKPYSRSFIAEKLIEAAESNLLPDNKQKSISKRQRSEERRGG